MNYFSALFSFRITYLMMFIFIGINIQAQPVHKIGNIDKLPSVENILFIVDSTQSISYSEIKSAGVSNFFKTRSNTNTTISENQNLYWLNFDLINKSDKTKTCYLEFNNWVYVNCYYEDENDKTIEKITGHFVPLPKRDYENGNRNLIRLSVNAGQALSVVVRLETSKEYIYRPPDLGFKLIEQEQFYENARLQDTIIAFFTGLFLVIILYNLFILFSTHDRAYYLYLIFVSFNLLALLLNFGYGHTFARNIISEMWIFNSAELFASSFYGITIILFTNRFLNVKKVFPGMFKGFVILMILLVLILIPDMMGNSLLSNDLSGLMGLITLTFTLIVAIRAYIRKIPSSGYFLLAQSVFIIGLVIFLTKTMGFLPETGLTTYSAQIGSSIEAILFSLALGNRINLLQKDNRLQQEALIVQLRENEKLQATVNFELERMVKVRTEELSEAHDKLLQQEKLAALGQITAGIAHEIKNPLNFVNNFSELSCELIDEIKLSKSESEKAQLLTHLSDNMSKIYDYGKRADKIINKMLMHSYTGSSSNIGSVSVNQTCEEAISLVYNTMQTRYPEVDFKINKVLVDNIPLLPINGNDFIKVIVSLLKNAFYYSHLMKGAKDDFIPCVSISTKLRNNSIKEKSAVIITISDNGIGMDEVTRKKIFQPFFTTKPSGEGVGLGLSLSHDMIVAYGGTILFDSQENKGTTFEIELPFNK